MWWSILSGLLAGLVGGLILGTWYGRAEGYYQGWRDHKRRVAIGPRGLYGDDGDGEDDGPAGWE